jgi:hypothetical protein
MNLFTCVSVKKEGFCESVPVSLVRVEDKSYKLDIGSISHSFSSRRLAFSILRVIFSNPEFNGAPFFIR